MEELANQIKELVGLMGFNDFEFNPDYEHKVISIIISDPYLTTERVPNLVVNLNRVGRLFTKQMSSEPVLIDVNNYRRERENLIIELAKAAARKVVASKEEVSLPTMNAYERRLVHTELSTRPDVKTESVGEGNNRYVVVKLVESN
ncbi:MAG: hypothetical protein M1361_00665 [Patescibacteria group bacterium]|nr:hypothetical protein [Patescibacteria group bacterium]MCL5224124.1 hypothetical protein [Patescibacteria group bacterium]